MYSNILVPVSFEEGRDSKGALAVAQALRTEGGKITCLHVMEILPQYATQYLPAGHLEGAKADIRESLEQMVAGIDNAKSLVIDGYASHTILDHAKHNAIDLIIIASHRPGMQDYLLGSTAAKVVRHAHCAVHVLR